MAMID